MEFGDPDNAALVTELEGKIDGMIAEYGEHVIPVPDNALIQQLFDSGRVVDESVVRAPTPVGSSRNPDLDTIPRMRLQTRPIASPRVERFSAAVAPAAAPAPAGATVPEQERSNLVWESSPLARRPLTIPTGANTKPTGSMLFAKGNSDIDQQTYFRVEVFDRLSWRADPRTAGKELAEADFRIVIRSVDYGVHRLTVTHDTRTDIPTYRAHQPMSGLRWGTARRLIAHDDLLDRTMRLYRDGMRADAFLIEID